MPAPKTAPGKPAAKEQMHQIVEAVQDFPLTDSPYWSELTKLSDQTEFDGIEVDPTGVTITNDEFEGLMNVYVGLSYGKGGGEALVSSDAFTGRFKGHFAKTGRPQIDEIAIDTAPFYEN
jgi:hypothetical protein